MNRIIMHIDVNNAFLSWTAVTLLEQGSKYDIRNSYAVIGGDEEARHGIVLAKSNPSKKLGIKTAETLYQARKKCKVLKVYKPDYNMYLRRSKLLFEHIKTYTPDIEIASIDECYLDYTSVKSLYGDPVLFAHHLKDEIYSKFGFTVNIGVANNKLCAKMASDFEKPNKVHTLFAHEIEGKMYPLPIGDLFGIGKKTSEKLIKLNIDTIGKLALTDPIFLEKYFKNQAINMINSAKGIDESKVISEEYDPSSISNETTLKSDTYDKSTLYHYLELLSNQVSSRIRKQNKYAKTVVVILKDNKFVRRQRQKKLVNATNVSKEIFLVAREILNEMYDETPIRLIGIRLDNLVNSVSYQTSLFDSIKDKESDQTIEKVIDEVNSKFGSNTLKRASIYKYNNK